MGGLKKGLSSITDLVGLTDTAALEAQQKAAREQQEQLAAQAALDNDQSGENLNQIDAGGAASASATQITGDQKRRRQGAASSALGI